MRIGIDLITEERDRQIYLERHTQKNDANLVNAELALAACAYALPIVDGISENDRIQTWPFDKKSFKPDLHKTKEGRIKELTKAGALIAAEIDRILNIK